MPNPSLLNNVAVFNDCSGYIKTMSIYHGASNDLNVLNYKKLFHIATRT